MRPGDLDTGDLLLTAEQVAARAGIGHRTLLGYIPAGRVPPPDSRIGRTPVWLETTIDRWLQERSQ